MLGQRHQNTLCYLLSEMTAFPYRIWSTTAPTGIIQDFPLKMDTQARFVGA